MRRKPALPSTGKIAGEPVPGQCLCGEVHIEIDFPARWAWHDHTPASRSWRRRFRITHGKAKLTRYADAASGTVRSFCVRCGTPICYERTRSPHMVNVPRALFKTRTGRQARYHIGIEQMPEWTYLGERLVPLKGFPGVLWDRSKRKPRVPPIAVT